MTVCQYCTPEWLEESALNYERKPEFKEQLKKLSIKLCYLVRATSLRHRFAPRSHA